MNLRRLLPYTSAAAVISILYIGWFFWNRWQEDKLYREAIEYKKSEPDRQTAQLLGTSVKVLNFYVNPSVVARGQQVLMCYGVANATNVSVDPPVDGIWPSVARCLNVAPRKTTTYRLTASDAAGHKATETVTVEVR